jgi:hypothetical protein
MPAPEIVGIHLECGGELGFRCLWIIQLLAGDAQQTEGSRILGLKAQGFQKPGFCFSRLVPLKAQEASELKGLGVLAIVFQGLFQGALSIVSALLEDPHIAQVAAGCPILGAFVPKGLQFAVKGFQILRRGVVPLGYDALEPDIIIAAIFGQQAVNELQNLLMTTTTVQGFGQGEGILS